jgi:hypothetical protein
MRTVLLQQLLAVVGVLFVAIALSNGDTRVLAAGVAAVAIAAVLAAEVASIHITPLFKARSEEQRTEAEPAPTHPTTAGRPLGRAPTGSIKVA